MSFFLVTSLLSAVLTFVFVWIKSLKRKAKVFVRKTNFYTIGLAVIFALLGLTAFLIREPAVMLRGQLLIWISLLVLSLGVLHCYLLYRVHPWSQQDRLKTSLIYTMFLSLLGGLLLFVVFWLIEGRADLSRSYADNFLTAAIFFPTPYFVYKSYEYWLSIPRQQIVAWTLPIDSEVPFIEPGRALMLHFQIPLNYRSKEVMRINTRAPVEKTIGEIFHYLLYRHNVERRAAKKIQIAEEDSRDKMYGWLFYKNVVSWWRPKRVYLPPSRKIKDTGIRNGEDIFVERIQVWKNIDQ